MPTGYTAPIYEGEEGFGLREYILRCSRAFGFAISMREEPLDKPPPKQIEDHNSYHAKSLRSSRARKEWLLSLSKAEIEREADKEYVEIRRLQMKSQKSMNERNARYETMRREINAWEAPEILENLKKFMLDQIDISTDTYTIELPDRKDYEPMMWIETQLNRVDRRIEQDEQDLQEEHERTQEANEYLTALWSSLP